MVKSAVKKPRSPEPESIEVNYRLDDLPTAQHKAGLAGLLLQIDSMNERKQAGILPEDLRVPEVLERSERSATIRFEKPSMQALFDDSYSARIVEVRLAKPWKRVTPKREEPNPAPGPGESGRWYFYDVIQPDGWFLRKFTDDGKEVWHRLWRKMLWKVPRSRPTTRTPFNARARGESTREGGDAWRGLAADEKLKLKGGRHTVEVAGPILLGAQSINAELVRFEDRADANLLLHFWPLTVRVFVPEVINDQGQCKDAGFVLAVPDVGDLTSFCRGYTKFLASLEARRRGYWPADAVIALPAQGPLEFMRSLVELTARNVISEAPSRHLAGVEFFHMVPAGQNVKLMAHGRIPPEDRLLARYGALRKHCKNPLLLSCRILAVLGDEPWFAALSGPLAERPWWFFVHSMQERGRTPPAMIGFAWEVSRRFRELRESYLAMKVKEADLPNLERQPDAVDRLIYDLVGSYVKERACARSGVKPDDEQWWKKTSEERRDICSKLFLELRSRNDDDFVRHFTATLGSVPQWLRGEKFLAVAAALMRPYTHDVGEDRPRTRDDVKTLTLLALSAHSCTYTPREDAADGAATDDEEPDA